MANDLMHYSGLEAQILFFPPELIVRTLSYLDQTCDRQNARLVCRGFAAAGLPSLTSTVYFSAFSNKILEIALHPVVSKYITKLVCDGTQLPSPCLDLPDFQSWLVTLGKEVTPEFIQGAHRMYASRHAKESWMIGTGEDRNIFREALKRFINLKCITFTDVAADKQNRWEPRPTWPSADPEGDL